MFQTTNQKYMGKSSSHVPFVTRQAQFGHTDSGTSRSESVLSGEILGMFRFIRKNILVKLGNFLHPKSCVLVSCCFCLGGFSCFLMDVLSRNQCFTSGNIWICLEIPPFHTLARCFMKFWLLRNLATSMHPH